MNTYKTHQLTFSVNNWSHLYSLQQAVSHLHQLSGAKLRIDGQVVNQHFLNNVDTHISIEFLQLDAKPDYVCLDSGEYLLGTMALSDQLLISTINVDRTVFEELRKNLMEYADIEGIHIMVTFEVISEKDCWQNNQQLHIIQLDYAMKGD